MISPRAYLATLCRAITLAGCSAVLFGCVQVGPRDFGVPHSVATPIQHPVGMPKPCPVPMVPPPIPEVVHITIEPGRPVQADAGGESFIRAYAAAREWAQKVTR
jgi:hypothetical protein